MDINELETYNLADAVKFNDRLNPRLWDDREHLRPEVREKLLAIADDFRESLGIKDIDLEDITISGSNAAFNYTPNSDIDLHLVVDIPEDEVYKELFDAKKFEYNNQHNIRIGGFPVELYVQDSKEPHISQGIYSILNNKWLSVPKRKKADINDSSVRDKYDLIQNQIEDAISTGDHDKMAKMMKRVKSLRKAGLDKSGEFSPENLAFKMLRTQGVIQKLIDARNEAKDRELSLAERNKAKKKYTYGFKEDVGGNSNYQKLVKEAIQSLRLKQKSKDFPIFNESSNTKAFNKFYKDVALTHIWESNKFLNRYGTSHGDILGYTNVNDFVVKLASYLKESNLGQNEDKTVSYILSLLSDYMTPNIGDTYDIIDMDIDPVYKKILVKINPNKKIIDIQHGMYQTTDGNLGTIGKMNISSNSHHTFFAPVGFGDKLKSLLVLKRKDNTIGDYQVNFDSDGALDRLGSELRKHLKEDATLTPDGVNPTTCMFLNELDSVMEIDYASDLGDIQPSSIEEILNNSKVCGSITGRDVHCYKQGSDLIVFFEDRNDIDALVWLKNGNLYAMKNFTNNSGMIYPLFHFLIDKNDIPVHLPPTNSLTHDGIKWIISQIKRGGFIVVDQNGNPIDTKALYNEWDDARTNGIAGPTAITIKESVRKKQILENENALMMYDYYGVNCKEDLTWVENINEEYKSVVRAMSKSQLVESKLDSVVRWAPKFIEIINESILWQLNKDVYVITESINPFKTIKLINGNLNKARDIFQEDATETPDGVNPTTCMFLNEEDKDPETIATDFIHYCVDKLGIETMPRIRFKKDPQWSVRNKTFGRYSDQDHTLVVSLANRHIMDILRTIAHELTHKRQHETQHMPMDAGDTGSKWENEANAKAGVLMRNYAKMHPEFFADKPLAESEVLDELTGVKKYHGLTSDELMAQIAKDYNLRILGTGAFGTVIQTRNPDIVVKVFEQDDAYLRFLEMANAYPNPHFPKSRGLPRLMTTFYKRYDIQPNKFVVVELEKLYPLDTDLARFCSNMVGETFDDVPSKTPSGLNNWDNLSYEQMSEDYPWILTLFNAIDQVIDSYLGHIDMHSGNFMQHKDGTIIITDPVYDDETHELGLTIQDKLDWKQPHNVQGPHYAKKQLNVPKYDKKEIDDLARELEINEATGYIPTKAQANDPRFKMALTKDVRPGTLGKCANAFMLNTDSQGHPQVAKASGKVDRLEEKLKKQLREFKQPKKLMETVTTFDIHREFFEDLASAGHSVYEDDSTYIDLQNFLSSIASDSPEIGREYYYVSVGSMKSMPFVNVAQFNDKHTLIGLTQNHYIFDIHGNKKQLPAEPNNSGYDQHIYLFHNKQDLDKMEVILQLKFSGSIKISHKVLDNTVENEDATLTPDGVNPTTCMFLNETDDDVPKMGINVRSDRTAGLNYADMIVDGEKSLETRRSDSLRPYVGKRVAIVRTGNGPAKAIGAVTVGEPIVADVGEFRKLTDKHKVPEGSAFDIQPESVKYLYPMLDPIRFNHEYGVGHGILSRKVDRD